MILALLLAAASIYVGVVLLRHALAARSSGVTETDEGDVIERARQPVRFTLFIAAQIAFGGLAVLVGAALVVASMLGWAQ
jgi:hypothetical protein